MNNNDLVIKSNTLIDASFKLTLAEFRLLNIVFLLKYRIIAMVQTAFMIMILR